MPRGMHVFHAVMVCVTFGFTAVTLFEEMQSNTTGTAEYVCIARIADGARGSEENHLAQDAALHGVSSVSRGSVRDFMTEYRGKLRFTLNLDQQSLGDRDLAVWQGLGIWSARFENNELVRKGSITHRSHALADFRNVARERRVYRIQTIPGLLQPKVVAITNVYLCSSGEKREFPFPCHGVVGTASQDM